MRNLDPEQLLLAALALLIALTIHEAAHAFVANALGDPTARNLGRLTLNPMAHLDPLGTILIVLSLLSGFGIGWGKPVPVNPFRLNLGARVGMAVVSAAGPASNMLLAALSSVILHASDHLTLRRFLFVSVVVNVFLAVLNLLPIPPLDGYKVLLILVPFRVAQTLAPLEQYGPVLLLLLIFAGRGLMGTVLGAMADPFLSAFLG